ncbi:MAG: hypothetical protein HYX47_07185 [Burkholderiales bacterium]|nr:hypothetical protein [Burkholderiales bacterium]
MKRFFMLAAACGALLLASGAQAFCVYNFTNVPVKYTGYYYGSGGAMDKTLKASKITHRDSKGNFNAEPVKDCCHWSNTDCSPGKRNKVVQSNVIVNFSTYNSGLAYHGDQCGIFIQGDGPIVKHISDGYMEIMHPTSNDGSMKRGSYFINVRNADGKLKARYSCPAAITPAKPGDFVPGPGDIFEALLS